MSPLSMQHAEANAKGFALLEILIVVAIIAILTGGGFYLKTLNDQHVAVQAGISAEQQAEEAARLVASGTQQEQNILNQISSPSAAVVYRNAQYGFTFSLPASWSGYSIVTTQWNGQLVSGSADSAPAAYHGPIISIRNPLWTAAKPYQDIPIMIFTLDQWKLVAAEELSVSAAPIPPSELGRNNKYVFALPARYNYAYPTGWEEVDAIVKGNALAAFDL